MPVYSLFTEIMYFEKIIFIFSWSSDHGYQSFGAEWLLKVNTDVESSYYKTECGIY